MRRGTGSRLYEDVMEKARIQSNDLMRRIQRVFQEEGISDSFRQIKAYDTIELEGTAGNGRERVLINEVIREYGEDAVKSSAAAQVLMPFIPEGVLKARSGETLTYTYFRATETDRESFDLDIREYRFYDGVFRLKYIALAQGLPKIDSQEDDGTIHLTCSCLSDFLGAAMGRTKEFSSEEKELLWKAAEQEEEKQKDEITKIVNHLITTFQAINFLNEQNQPESAPATGGSISREIQEDITGDTKKTKKIHFSYKPSKASLEQPGTEGRGYTRRTEKWLVTGHMRHLKSGRTVYIQPFYKGPGRECTAKGKRTYQIQEGAKNEEITGTGEA
ncbi:MAG: hypothetical protein LUE14_04545 [Clostridiales bacterium]|nr:hypothetical protein [Clostridiales bacterium]